VIPWKSSCFVSTIRGVSTSAAKLCLKNQRVTSSRNHGLKDLDVTTAVADVVDLAGDRALRTIDLI
jgi:hypothetical protein